MRKNPNRKELLFRELYKEYISEDLETLLKAYTKNKPLKIAPIGMIDGKKIYIWLKNESFWLDEEGVLLGFAKRPKITPRKAASLIVESFEDLETLHEFAEILHRAVKNAKRS